jgi:aminoglycoside phosphotransferase (APT) family kinase protein
LVLRTSPTDLADGRRQTILREYRLLSALGPTNVPHARVLGASTDTSVTGAPFYVMEYVEGWSPAEIDEWPRPFSTDPMARRELALRLVEGIGELSKVDWVGAGLGDFGRPDGFHARQVDRWSSQLANVQVRDLPGMPAIAEWLRRHKPMAWSPGIMHGDYQFANVIFANEAPARLAAIIDWELATIGDPVLDLAWVLISDDWNADRMDLTGMPEPADLVERYEETSGRAVTDLDYYLVLARYKMAVLLEGGYVHSIRAGTPDDVHFGDVSLRLAAHALSMVEDLS